MKGRMGMGIWILGCGRKGHGMVVDLVFYVTCYIQHPLTWEWTPQVWYLSHVRKMLSITITYYMTFARSALMFFQNSPHLHSCLSIQCFDFQHGLVFDMILVSLSQFARPTAFFLICKESTTPCRLLICDAMVINWVKAFILLYVHISLEKSIVGH